MFRTADQYDLYLQDTPDKEIFESIKRALGNPCVAIERAADLAQLLLNADQQPLMAKQLAKNVAKQKRQTFMLTSPIPISVTYITCALKDGQLVIYDDPYQLDGPLQAALYQLTDKISAR